MESLRGQLLVAGPTLLDPNFRRTVVLVCEHSEEGALGLVVNRATALEVAEAVPELADVLYERRNVEPLAELLPRLGGEVLLADPGRPPLGDFLARRPPLWARPPLYRLS